jgi:hypothetical protein
MWMWMTICRWLGIKLIMFLKGRDPDFVWTSPMQGALPYHNKWYLIRPNPVLNVSLIELVSSDFHRWPGFTITLLGWYRIWFSDEPGKRRCRLKSPGSFTFRSGRIETPDSGRSWVLRIKIGR